MQRQPTNRLAIGGALLLALLQCQLALAQDTSSAPTYPTWVTNDYPCVIKCIEDQLKDQQPPASDGQVSGALGCVRDACSKATAEGNVYQAHYIINMFNSIGSIYEPESWQAGNAPNASDLMAPEDWVQTATTATWTEGDQPTTVTTSVWVPPATSSEAATTSSVAATTSVVAVASGSAGASGTSIVKVSGSPSASASGANNGSTGNGTAGEEGGAGRMVADAGVGMLVLLGAGLAGGAMGGAGLLGW